MDQTNTENNQLLKKVSECTNELTTVKSREGELNQIIEQNRSIIEYQKKRLQSLKEQDEEYSQLKAECAELYKIVEQKNEEIDALNQEHETKDGVLMDLKNKFILLSKQQKLNLEGDKI